MYRIAQQINLGAGLGVAIREFSLRTGAADYLLMVNREAVGVVEAKPLGHSFNGCQGTKCEVSGWLATTLPAAREPLPFHYETTGNETRFTSNLDPVPRSRQVFSFHRPQMLQDWLAQAPEDGENNTLRARLLRMPELATHDLRDCQIEAITNLERSFTQESSACPDSNGNWQRQDLHRRKLHLSPDQIWRGTAHPLPGGS